MSIEGPVPHTSPSDLGTRKMPKATTIRQRPVATTRRAPCIRCSVGQSPRLEPQQEAEDNRQEDCVHDLDVDHQT